MTNAGSKQRWRRPLIPAIAATALFALACSSNSNSNKTATVAVIAATQAATSAATAATSAAAASPTAAAAASPGKVTKIVMQVNWFAEPENAGELMAKMLNLFPPSIDVEVKDGGPGINLTTSLATGQIQMATCSADGILTAKEQGIELVGLMAAFQDNPQVLMAHPEAGIKGFEDMKGKSVAVSAAAIYYDYLAKKYAWNTNDKATYSGTLANFLADKKLISQGYYTAEPFYLQKQGLTPDVFLIAKAGYDPYASLLCATKDFVQKNPDAVKAFVQADQKGWQALLKAENQKLIFPEIQKRNKDEDPEGMAYALSKMPDLMFNDDTKANGFGHMTDERWKTMMDQMVDLKVLKAPVDYKSLFSNDFLLKDPAGAPPTPSATPAR